MRKNRIRLVEESISKKGFFFSVTKKIEAYFQANDVVIEK